MIFNYLNNKSIKIIEENLITKAIEIKLKIYFNIFKKYNLNYNEFIQLIIFIYKHYYSGNVDKKTLEKMQSIFNKLNKNVTLPNTIYRGLLFNTKNKELKDLQKFLKDLENKKIKSKSSVLSWSINLKISKLFATWYQRMLDDEIGILISLSKENYKDYYLFSLYLFFKNDKEFQDFMQFVYEAVFVLDSKLTKKIKLNDNSIYYQGHKVLQGMHYVKFEKEILTLPIELKYLDKKNISFQIYKRNKKIKELSYENFLRYMEKNYEK